MEIETTVALLEASGYEVLAVGNPPGVPEPMAAYLPVISLGAEPVAEIPITDDGAYLLGVQRAWEESCVNSKVVSVAGECLLWIPGPDVPWAHVRRHGHVDVPRELAARGVGDLEFVAMSLDGRRVCGVTEDEDSVLVVVTTVSVPEAHLFGGTRPWNLPR